MSTLTLGIIVIIYMFVIAWLGYLGYRQTKNASDYLLGGRKVNPIIMALSYGATFISASAIVGFGGVAATFGMGIQWLCLLNMFMGVVVAFIFFGRRTRKLGEAHNARTFPQLLGDALQAVIMFACMLFLLFWFYHIMDMGFIEANQKLTDIAPMVPERFKALGHQGWTAMPISGSPQWYTLVTSLILGVGISCLAQPQLVVRFMMVESTKQLNRGVLIGCVFLIVTVGAIYHVGALSNLFFLKTEGVVASEAVKDMDKIIPLFINKAMPEWFGAVFMLCILSASMSTLSAQFHTMGAAFGADAFPKLGRSKNPNSTLGVRIGVLCSILVSYVICYTLSASIIARGTALFMGICAATFLPTYFCSLYWKGATRQGALASLWVGGLASLFAMLFLHKAEAAPVGLCKALFGQDVLIDVYPWHAIDPILFALPLSAITIVLVSLATQKKVF